jgi:hypothetical protein
LLSYFIRCGNSSYFDIVQEQFDFNNLQSTKANANLSVVSLLNEATEETKLNKIERMVSINSNSLNQNNHENNYEDEHPFQFELTKNACTGATVNNSVNNAFNTSALSPPKSREVKVFELGNDPLEQFQAVLNCANMDMAHKLKRINSVINKNQVNNANNNSKNSTMNRISNTEEDIISKNQQSQYQSKKPDGEDMNFMSPLSISPSLSSPSSAVSPASNENYTSNSSSNSSIVRNQHTSTSIKKQQDIIKNQSTNLDANFSTTNVNNNNSKNKSSAENKHALKYRKHRNFSSNSIGENCNAQELPLIG